MGYTITNLDANATSGVGVATYRVTLTDGTGRYADTGAAFSGAYSGMPGVNADQSPRSTDATGAYIGMGAFDLAPLDSSVWMNPSLGPDEYGGVSPIGSFSPGLVGDSAAIAVVQSAASDAAVLSAATAALAAGSPPVSYPISVNISGPTTGTVSGSGSGTLGYTSSGGGDPHAGIFGGPVWTTSDPSIVTVDTTAGVENPTFLFHAAGTATVTATVVSVGGPAMHGDLAIVVS